MRARRRCHALALFAAGCLSTPPGSVAPGDDGGGTIDAGICGAAEWADAAVPVTPDAVGNVLSLDFDDPAQAYTFRDRSGWRRDAARLSGMTGNGKHGNAMLSDAASFAMVADDGFELGDAITIAAWIYVDEASVGAVFSDYKGGAEYDLHVDGAGDLVFASTGKTGDQTTSTGPLITPGAWFHVAVTWSGNTVTLYVDGVAKKTDTTFVAPMVHSSPFYIGRRADGLRPFIGKIDDLRIWDHALGLADIAAFRTAVDEDQRCGDGVIQSVESCERGDPCCAGCAPSNQGCGGECGTDGVCITDCARPTRGLVALYRFDEGDGNMVHDTAEVEPALDLGLAPDEEFAWTADGLELTGASAGSLLAADRILDGFDETGEFTFDIWLTPGDQLADELVRLVSLDSGTRGLILGIWDSSYVAQFAVDSVDPSTGHPALEAFDRVQLGRSTHLVLTRSNDGTRRIYVDGVLREQSRAPGHLDWESTRMLLGDAPSGGRNFVGTLHRVAIHSVALDPIEVAASFHAGPR